MTETDNITGALSNFRERALVVLNDKWTFLAIGAILTAAYYSYPEMERAMIDSYQECIFHYMPEAKLDRVARALEDACYEMYGTKS